MTLKVDKAGRIVLPKPVRDRLRLHPGSDLVLEESPDGILLRPIEPRASLIEKHGLLVHRGEGPCSIRLEPHDRDGPVRSDQKRAKPKTRVEFRETMRMPKQIFINP